MTNTTRGIKDHHVKAFFDLIRVRVATDRYHRNESPSLVYKFEGKFRFPLKRSFNVRSIGRNPSKSCAKRRGLQLLTRTREIRDAMLLRSGCAKNSRCSERR